MVDVSHVLRRLALDESVKARIASDPVYTGLLRKVARRYVSGTTRQDALAAASALNAAGHAATNDYMGESTRSMAVAEAALTEFLALTDAIETTGARASVSLDLSHLGNQLDREVGLAAARRLAADSEELARRFDEYATALLTSGHPCAIATHDEARIAHARSVPATGDHYFEVLQGLGETIMQTSTPPVAQPRCTSSTARRSGCTCATAWRKTPGGLCGP